MARQKGIGLREMATAEERNRRTPRRQRRRMIRAEHDVIVARARDHRRLGLRMRPPK